MQNGEFLSDVVESLVQTLQWGNVNTRVQRRKLIRFFDGWDVSLIEIWVIRIGGLAKDTNLMTYCTIFVLPRGTEKTYDVIPVVTGILDGQQKINSFLGWSHVDYR